MDNEKMILLGIILALIMFLILIRIQKAKSKHTNEMVIKSDENDTTLDLNNGHSFKSGGYDENQFRVIEEIEYTQASSIIEI